MGFVFSKLEKGGKISSLLPELKGSQSKNAHVVSAPASAMEPKLPEANKAATVKLIQATRLPANHVKLVRASVENSELIGSVCLFEPDLSRLHQKRITMSDRLEDGETTVTLLVNNQGENRCN